MSSGYRRFYPKGDTLCTRCKTIQPTTKQMEALPPRAGIRPWKGFRCVPTCVPACEVSNGPAPSTPKPFSGPKSAPRRQHKPRKGVGMKLLSDEELVKVEGMRSSNERRGGASTAPASSGRIAPSPTRLDFDSNKRPHSKLNGGMASVRPPPPAKKPRTAAGPGSNASPSAPAAPRPLPQPTPTAGAAGAPAAAGATGAPPVHPGAAHRGGRGTGDGGDGVEVVRQVSVDERIAENQRKQGVIDLGDGNGLTPPSVPLPPASAARARAKGAGGGSGGKRAGGGAACNLAVTEAWTQAAGASGVSVPVKLEPSAAKSAVNNVPAGLPSPVTPAAPAAAPAAVPATAPAPAAQPPFANGGRGGGRISVSDIFRLRGVSFDIRIAGTVGKKAKTMFVEECRKAAGQTSKKKTRAADILRRHGVRKRPALDGNLNTVPAPWGPVDVPENAYPAWCKSILEDAFESVVGTPL